MDSNVSKKTFLHKFFKLGFNHEEASISIKELLKQMLLSTLNLSQQSLNISFDPLFINRTVGSKIILLYSSIESISSSQPMDRVLFTSESPPIIYSCSIALLLASQNKKRPQVIAEKLIDLLVSPKDKSDLHFDFNFTVEILKSGLINFYLDDGSIAIWLNKLLVLLNKDNLVSSSNLFPTKLPDSSHLNLFPAQYIHARCCTLLRLGAREKLFIGGENSQFTSWLDEQGNLWLRKEIELILLRQLFLVTDLFVGESVDWYKTALNLSKITAVFLAECRLMGKIQQETPQKAIAYLKLIAITQYWLQRILLEKLNVAAPTSL